MLEVWSNSAIYNVLASYLQTAASEAHICTHPMMQTVVTVMYHPRDTTAATRVTVDGRLAGNAFACRWQYQDKTVCWVTQLVVHRDFRERGLGSGLLNSLREETDDIYGIMSSHPAACLAASSSFGCTPHIPSTTSLF